MPHFEAHYNVKILPKESSRDKVLEYQDGVSPLSRSRAVSPQTSELLHVSGDDNVHDLIQSYISETKKLIYEFTRFENGIKEGSYPRSLPEDSIDQLANVHQNASKTLLNIRKSYQKANPAISKQNFISRCRREEKVAKPTKSRAQSTRKADHSIVAFTIKANKPQTSMIDELSPNQDYLNRDLCLKTNTMCTQCGSTQTPEWRSGPSGSRTLCNACGLFYSKLVKKLGVASACDCLKKRKRTVNIDTS